MDLSKLLYKILKITAERFGQEETPPASELYTPDILNDTEPRIEQMLYRACKEGYIDGLRVLEIDGLKTPKVMMSQSYVQITIKGIEYIENNTTMKKIASTLKGIKEIIPGV